MNFKKSARLDALRYEIRGPVYEKSLQLAREGFKITQLNIGNPAPFGFETPDEIVHDIIANVRGAQGYADSRGLFAARKAVMQYYQSRGVRNAQIDDVIIGNGVSELIVLVMQALLNEGDEVLIPSPDYPLWTTAVGLCGGKPAHYVCDEQSDWNPDLKDLESKITKRTKAVVIINPNNPTGAVYEKETVEGIVRLAEKHKLIVFSDEIYDKILYDGAKHHTIATMSDETLCVVMGGLSKNYRAAGFRGGWMILTGARAKAASYIEGLNFLAGMRLCSNVFAQYGIQTALGGYQSIDDLVASGGRLHRQMNFVYDRITAIPGISCVKPKGAMYLFPRIDLAQFSFKDDNEFIYDLLVEHHILMVAGNGFNYPTKDHFRIVFLPNTDILAGAMKQIELFLETRRVEKRVPSA